MQNNLYLYFNNIESLINIIDYIIKICQDKFKNFEDIYQKVRGIFISDIRKELDNSSQYIIEKLKNENEREINKYNKEKIIWEQEEANREFWEKLSNEYRDIKGKIYKL